MILIILLNALLACVFTTIKLIGQHAQPFFNMGIRMIVAGGIILGLKYFLDSSTHTLRKSHWFFYAQAILFTLFIPFMLRAWGIQYMPAYRGAFLCNIGPFFSYLLSCVFYAEKVRIQKILGLLVGFLGTLPIIFSASTSFPENSIAYLPEVAMIASVASASYGWLIIHMLIRHYNYSPMILNGVAMFGTGFLALGSSCIVEDSARYISDLTPFVILLSITIGTVGVVYNLLYAQLLKKYTPTMLAFGSFLTPLFAGLYGWLFFGEKVGGNFFLANIVVLSGLTLFYVEELRIVTTIQAQKV